MQLAGRYVMEKDWGLAALTRVLPLILSLAAGAVLVYMMATLSFKWAIFSVGAFAGISVFILIGLFTTRLRGGLLFLAVLALPAFYDINFLYRENVKFSVLANGFGVNLVDVFIFPLVLAWIYDIWWNPNRAPIRFPRLWLLVLFGLLGINLCSAFFVAAEPFFSYSMIYAQLKCYFLMFFIANYVRDEKTFRLLGYAFAAVLLFEGLVVLEQRFVGVLFTAANLGHNISLKSKVGMGSVVRLAGTLDHPNALAMYINLSLPWVGFLFLHEKYSLRKVYLGAAVLLAFLTEVSTGSRGGWLGLAVAVGICTFFWKRKQGRNPFVGLAVMGFVITLLFSVLFVGSQTFRDRLVEGDAGSAEVRYPLMAVAMEMIKENPIQGVGLNLYTREMVPYDRTNHFIAYRYDQPVHNTFLMVAAETGLPSMLLFSIFIFVLIRAAYRVMAVNDGVVSTVGIGILGTLVSWFLHNQVNLTAPYGDLTLWTLFGTLAAAVNYTDRMEAERREALATSLRKARA